MDKAIPAVNESSRPNYVSYGGEQVFQQPYIARNTRLTAFLLPIAQDNRALPQRFLDRVFNHTSGGAVDFQVAFPFVLLTFQRFGDLGALNPPDSLKGGFAYNEATLWLPVTNKAQSSLNLSYFVPYIFADNHYAIAAGREVYGYPKALGQIELPTSHTDLQYFCLETEVIKKFSPEALGEKAILFEVTPPSTSTAPENSWHHWEHAVEHLVEKVADEAINFVLQDLFQPKVEMVFLKQFRDVADGAVACYQSIVRGAGAITGFAGGGPLHGDYTVTINSYDSHPIAADLGLPATTHAHGFYLDFTFDILPGEEIWKAS